jgi:acyl-CoA reductase-like NAD-dependent aldehyde dehydrogenase
MRATYASGRTKSLQWRKQQLRQLLAALIDNHEEVTSAIRADLGGPKIRGFAELQGAVSGARFALENLDSWAADEKSAGAPIGGEAFVRSEPKGLLLVIAPWCAAAPSPPLPFGTAHPG